MAGKGDRKVLGRGLSALMADVKGALEGDGQSRGGIREIPVGEIRPNANQPRQTFHRQALEELTESIRRNGVLQPIIVRTVDGSEGFEIVAGERRWRAAALAGLETVPAVSRQLDDEEALQVAIIENIQREDLDAIEEASSYRRLMDNFGHTQDQVAAALGKSRSHIANLLRLLTLPDSVKAQVRNGALSAGHARVLVTAYEPERLAAEIVGKSLTVRQAEDLARRAGNRAPQRRPRQEKDADTRAIEGDLTATLRMLVRIDHGAAGEGGTLSVRYVTLDDLDFLCRVLSSASRDTVL